MTQLTYNENLRSRKDFLISQRAKVMKEILEWIAVRDSYTSEIIRIEKNLRGKIYAVS